MTKKRHKTPGVRIARRVPLCVVLFQVALGICRNRGSTRGKAMLSTESRIGENWLRNPAGIPHVGGGMILRLWVLLAPGIKVAQDHCRLSELCLTPQSRLHNTRPWFSRRKRDDQNKVQTPRRTLLQPSP
ncbi:hypothetical protein GGR56DRAFT_642726 [Xylariaceae sp. FL0804]|nr:hypothetical protein GGR56DRAFT_642726 [Xylariaceae sp. FL0804]